MFTVYLLIYITINIIGITNASCESDNFDNLTNSSFLKSNKSEPYNAVSSLIYCVFGSLGYLNKNNHSTYYIIMHLSIITGISSFLHHYFYIDSYKWAYDSDILSLIILISFSNIYFNYQLFSLRFWYLREIINLLILINMLSMLVLNNFNKTIRTYLVQSNIIYIFLTQIYFNFYFYIFNLPNKLLILKSTILNLLIFGLSAFMWYLDSICPSWFQNYITPHFFWHIGGAWSLFNVIQIGQVCRAQNNYLQYDWKPLLFRFPWLFFIIQINNKKSNVKNNYTHISLEEVNLLGNNNHRRSISYT